MSIPMRIDPAQFWEGLYLYYHENGFISDRVKDDKPRAIKFKIVPRLIDDECNLNDFGPPKYKKVEIPPPSAKFYGKKKIFPYVPGN